MKSLLAAAVLLALTLTGCSQFLADPVVPAPVELVEPAPVEIADGITEQDAEDFANAVCVVLDTNGVSAGVHQMFAIASDSGFTHEEIAPLLAAAVHAGCPEYKALIALEASTL